MSKSNKTKEYAVRYLYDTMKMDAATIAKELKISVEDVNSVLQNAEPQEEESNDKSKTSKAHQMMIRHTSSKKTNNVSIMTEGASQYNDSMRAKINTKASRSSKDAIYRPRNG